MVVAINRLVSQGMMWNKTIKQTGGIRHNPKIISRQFLSPASSESCFALAGNSQSLPLQGNENEGKCRVDSRGLCDTADNCICSAIDPLNRVSENPCI